MAHKPKINAPVTLFAVIEAKQHEALRLLAFEERRSIADVVREAISQYLRAHSASGTILEEKRRAVVGGYS